jgi:hypothetical protein
MLIRPTESRLIAQAVYADDKRSVLLGEWTRERQSSDDESAPANDNCPFPMISAIASVIRSLFFNIDTVIESSVQFTSKNSSRALLNMRLCSRDIPANQNLIVQ